MRARIPYLARLTQQTAGQATLRPSPQLFADDSYPPRRRPDQDAGPAPDAEAAVRGGRPVPFPPPADDPGGVHTPRAAELNASRRGVTRGAARAGGDLDIPVVPVPELQATRTAPTVLPAPLSPPTAPAAPAVPTGAPGALAPRAASPPARAEPAGVMPPARSGPADVMPPARSGPADVMPPARAEAGVPGPRTAPLISAGTAEVRPPADWPHALWDGPVELPIEQPTAGGTGAPVTAMPPSRPAAPAPGPVPGGSGGWDPGRDADGSAVPGLRHQAGQVSPSEPNEPTGSAPGQLTPPVPIASGRLLPRSGPVPDPVPVLGPEPPGPAQQPGLAQQPGPAAPPGVSIGTIEVTVVPPAPPPPGLPQVQATRQAPGLAEGTGTGRLREGLRRWYGTAQG